MANADLAIRVEGVGKRYTLGEGRSGYDLLSERLDAVARTPARWLRGHGRSGGEKQSKEAFWALRDVSLELRPGETLGLIGANGAGKSTLLKLMSRITLPTEGRITLVGRVATLLEVGTGFHPELTGRENVYLSGTILGMRKREIDAAFEQIVEFSNIERFLDTPVKRYSSGMYVRLAFAIAAHLNPEIMLVDEVLAVGDTEFQKKCLGKMRDVSEQGRAVVFVSHNLLAIQRLCDRVLLLERGRVIMDGKTAEVLSEYYDRIDPDQSAGAVVIPADHPRRGAGGARLVRAAMTDAGGEPASAIRLGEAIRLRATFEVDEEAEAVMEVGVSTGEGQRVATAFSTDRSHPPLQLLPGLQEIAVELDLPLVPGDYVLDIALHIPGNITSKGTGTAVADIVERVLRFSALNVGKEGDAWPTWRSPAGFARPNSSWELIEDRVLT